MDTKGLHLAAITLIVICSFANSPPPFRNQPVSNNSKVEAFLDAIAYAEGTSDNYKMMFTGKLTSDLSRHPDQINCARFAGRRLCSSAAGRYQFLTPTWNRLQKKLNLPDFSPQSQDLAAIELLRESGALQQLESGDLEGAIATAAKIWASLPTENGKSAYNQPVKSLNDFIEKYREFGGAQHGWM